MRFDYPAPEQIPGLRQLWKTAFGDTDEFLDSFFSTAFSPRRCRCVLDSGHVAAALYWFDISWENQKGAYIYAVATDPEYQGQGLCRRLMADTESVLTHSGYRGALLVPQSAGLFSMYAKMGYRNATSLDAFPCAASEYSAPISEISPAEYAARRRLLLPPGGVIQEGEALRFLETQAKFYAGSGFLAAVSRETAHLRILEFLGEKAGIGPLVAALGHREAIVRTPGQGIPFSMFRPLFPDCVCPSYFAFCFD